MLVVFTRNLPLAILIAIPLTTCCYVLVNLSYLAILTPQEIIGADAVAVVTFYHIQARISAGFIRLLHPGMGESCFGTGQLSHSTRSGHVRLWYGERFRLHRWQVITYFWVA